MNNDNVGKIWDKKWEKLSIEKFQEEAFQSDPWTLHHRTIIEKYAANIGKDGIFLEAGCGMGHWCFYVSQKYGIKSLGADIARETIEKLKKNRRENVDFVTDDLNDSCLEDNHFDMLISLGVIEHFKDSDPMMKNLHRILKLGGIGIISVPNVFSMHTITRPMLQLIGKWDIGYEKSFSPKKLKKLAKRNGFEVIESGVLPSGEMFGLFLNHLPIIGRLFRKLSLLIENNQNIFGFISCVVVRKIRDKSKIHL